MTEFATRTTLGQKERMATPKNLYVHSIHKKLGYFPTWLPGSSLALGDIGVLRDGIFVHRGRLADRGITFSQRIDPHERDFSHTSESGVHIEAGGGAGGGDVVPSLGGSIEIRFTTQGAFLFQAQGCQRYTISDQLSLEDQLRVAYQDGSWELDWVVVTEVFKANRATILIANSKEARLSFVVRGDLEPGRISLAGANAKLGVESQSGDLTKVVAESGLTLLYQMAWLRKAWLSQQIDFDNVRSGDGSDTDSVRLQPLTLEELEA